MTSPTFGCTFGTVFRDVPDSFDDDHESGGERKVPIIMSFAVNLGHKLLGSGFRGPHENVVAQNQPQSTYNILGKAQNVNNGAVIASPSVASVAGFTGPNITTAIYFMRKVVPRLMHYAREVMQEDIPDRERNLDRIKARIFAWSACHQRQESWETNDRSAGLFTQIFTESCLRLAGPGGTPDSFTYNQLFTEVSERVAEKRACAGLSWGNSNPAPQFVQLWTSLKSADRATKVDTLLDLVIDVVLIVTY